MREVEVINWHTDITFLGPNMGYALVTRTAGNTTNVFVRRLEMDRVFEIKDRTLQLVDSVATMKEIDTQIQKKLCSDFLVALQQASRPEIVRANAEEASIIQGTKR